MSLGAPGLFLIASLVGAGFTGAALLRRQRLGAFSFPYFMGAWLTGELALHHVAWQAAATVLFIAGGALARWPGWLALAINVASWTALVALQRRAARLAPLAFARALEEGLGSSYRTRIPDDVVALQRAEVGVRVLARPFRMRVSEVERIRNIAYADAGRRNLLDVYRPRERSGPCPVLLQIHGGAWVSGQKDNQALPLLYYLAARGWVCVAINYRLAPRAAFPAQLVDAKLALAWIRRHGAEHGADPGFVAVTGGSAGGHLASLVALSANEPEYQPGFAEVDTSVAACVPFYGVYDFLDRHGVRGKQAMRPFLERFVMKSSPEADREGWEKASPIARVRADAPPFFVVHGTHDSLAWVEEAVHFVAALRAVSRSPVLYAEVPGAQHAFDLFHSVRSAQAVHAVAWFLEWGRAGRGQAANSTFASIGPEGLEPARKSG